MLPFFQIVCRLGRLINHYRCSFIIAVPAILLFSAFHSRPDDWASQSSKALPPPDSLSVVNPQLQESLLKEFRSKRLADSLVNFALSLKGSPYKFGGEAPDGFDCSGFIFYVFEQFNCSILRSSRSQSTEGKEIEIEAVQKGDLLFFTGTNPEKRQVGHVGIIISGPEEEISFVHSSSNGGVKVSQLDGYYQTRLMFAKRMMLSPEKAK